MDVSLTVLWYTLYQLIRNGRLSVFNVRTDVICRKLVLEHSSCMFEDNVGSYVIHIMLQKHRCARRINK